MYKDKNCTQPTEVLDDVWAFERLCDRVFTWGLQRNITAAGGATSLTQIRKLKEEVSEIEAGLLSDNEDEIRDGIGDTLVVLLQICRLGGFNLEDCLAKAWDSIKDRKGTMVNGVFVKEAK